MTTREDNDDEFLGAFETPPEDAHPAAIARALMQLPELKHLDEHDVEFLWLMRHTEHIVAGRRIIGMVHEPLVQGRLRDLFSQMLVENYGTMPDYIVTLDSAFWRDATPVQRQALVHHELMHVQQAVDADGEPRINRQTGEPIFVIMGHDIEEFNLTVERFGLWKPDVERFAETIRKVSPL